MKSCGPQWAKDFKLIPIDICDFFCPCCKLHDEHYSTWMCKWVADLKFLQNLFKRINKFNDMIPKRRLITLKIWAVLFYVGVSIPILSHISYFKGKRVFE